jgi:ArsR family transcriptional regulator
MTRTLDLPLLARALGHPARIDILRVLARRTACVCGEIVDELPLAQSTVSQHLKVLKEAGLIQGTIDGPRTCYCLDAAAIAAAGEALSAFFAALQADSARTCC